MLGERGAPSSSPIHLRRYNAVTSFALHAPLSRGLPAGRRRLSDRLAPWGWRRRARLRSSSLSCAPGTSWRWFSGTPSRAWLLYERTASERVRRAALTRERAPQVLILNSVVGDAGHLEACVTYDLARLWRGLTRCGVCRRLGLRWFSSRCTRFCCTRRRARRLVRLHDAAA